MNKPVYRERQSDIRVGDVLEMQYHAGLGRLEIIEISTNSAHRPVAVMRIISDESDRLYYYEICHLLLHWVNVYVYGVRALERINRLILEE